jgi:predicted transcriptional regulator
MAAVKVTFTLDEGTVGKLSETAKRLAKPKSQVVREAIEDYHAKSDRLSEAERLRMMRALEELKREPPTRTEAETDRELREIRASRRRWSRQDPSEKLQ